MRDLLLPGTSKNPRKDGAGEFHSNLITAAKRLNNQDAPSRARVEIKQGDVIFSLVRPYLKNIAVVPSTLDGQVASTAFCCLRPSPDLDTKYLFYQLLQDSFIHAIPTYGNSPPAARDDEFLGMPIALPTSKRKQEEIAAELDELLSDLDAGVANLKRAQTNLKRYRAAVLKAAVEGRLTEAWRKHNPPSEAGEQLLARLLKQRRAKWEADQLAKFARKTPPKGWQSKYVEPAAPHTTDLPELPEGWCWATLGQCFNVEVGATPSRREATYWGGDIPWVSSGEVQFCRISSTRETITNLGLANSSTKVNPAGSVLLGMIGEGKTRGQAAILDIDAANNQNCAAIWVSQTDIPPEYVYYWLYSQYEATRRGGSGNNQPALNKTLVCQIPLPLGPVEEIRQVVGLLDEVSSTLDHTETETNIQLAKAASLRQSILKAAFSGKLLEPSRMEQNAEPVLFAPDGAVC